VPNQRWWLAALLVVTLLFVVIGGWAAVVVPLLAALGFVRPAALPWVAGAGALGAGICVLAGLGAPVAAVGHGAFSALAQVFALVSLAAVFVPVAAREPAR
jgi:arabinofuranan 3-O-arabinosyltransferase